jgi:hypothetical protein
MLKWLREKLEPNNSSSKEFEIYLSNFRKDVDRLVSNLDYEPIEGEVLPPWMVVRYPFYVDSILFPDDISAHFYWASGPGSQSWREFLEYWWGLNFDQMKDYFRKFDLGEDWEERMTWFFNLFGEDTLSRPTFTKEELYKFMDEVFHSKF